MVRNLVSEISRVNGSNFMLGLPMTLTNVRLRVTLVKFLCIVILLL